MANQLDSITIKGFRSIRNIERLSLRPINLLIGANGSGKSNFVEAFGLLRALVEGRLAAYTDKRGGGDRLAWMGKKATEVIELEASFDNQTISYHIQLGHSPSDRLYVISESCAYPEAGRSVRASLFGPPGEAGISVKNTFVPAYFLETLNSFRTYHFHDTSESSPMKQTAKIDDNRYLRPDGSNLASFLYLLRESFPDSFRVIRAAIQRVAPFLRDFQLAPLMRDNSAIKLEWIHDKTDKYFDASSLSDGTLRFICLAVLLLQPEHLQPSVILLDEPELGLHPYAISLLASMIKSASHHAQLIVATQSGFLLDHFDPEDVLVAELDDGGTALKRLSAEPLREWLEDYSLGQLWEKNEIGGRPRGG